MSVLMQIKDVLGDLTYITGSRVLDGGKNLIEYSLLENGKFRNIEVVITSTFWTIPTAKDTVYGEA